MTSSLFDTPPPQPVTIFLKPTFAIVPTENGLNVRVAASPLELPKPPRKKLPPASA